jgi:hypothetical protein
VIRVRPEPIGVNVTRVVDTRGWIAGDLHVHSKNSIDSSLSLVARNDCSSGSIRWWASR